MCDYCKVCYLTLPSLKSVDVSDFRVWLNRGAGNRGKNRRRRRYGSLDIVVRVGAATRGGGAVATVFRGPFRGSLLTHLGKLGAGADAYTQGADPNNAREALDDQCRDNDLYAAHVTKRETRNGRVLA